MNAPRALRLVDPGATQAVSVSERLRKPLGQILVDAGKLTPGEKLSTLELQARHDLRFGDLLVARGVLKRRDITEALATQFQTEVANLEAMPPDVTLIEAFGVDRVLETGALPLQRRGQTVIVASSRPDTFDDLKPELEALFGHVTLRVTSERILHEAVIQRYPRALAVKAETRVDDAESCRNWSDRYAKWLLIAVVAFGVATLLAPKAVFYALMTWTLLTLVLQTALKTVAWIFQLVRPVPRPAANPVPMTRLPKVSILVALYKEREIAKRLIRRLDRIDYPPDLLDICLVVEADDRTTQEALDDIDLPPHMRRIVVPDGALKTKPRALNYALEFCHGSIVGVYDAEDAPAPDQIRKIAARFHAAPQEVACLQGVLDYYNAHRNWIARCFTIEYATWFRVILPGYLKLGLVIPLGGTTLFFRRDVLDAIGGWDAHNVTEDADLGIRLARHGYRTELVDSVTEEEANCRIWPWIKQRSRWLKGYAVTWVVHTSRPGALIRDLGLWRALGVQLLLLGTLTQFAVAPLLWSFWLLALGFEHIALSDLGAPLIWTIAGIFIVSEAISILIRVHAVGLTRHQRLKRWVPTLYFYFPMAALAAYKGGIELMTKPFYWDKTSHGTDDRPDTS